METQEESLNYRTEAETRARLAYYAFRGLRDRDMQEDAQAMGQEERNGWHVTRRVESNRLKEFKFLTKNK